jgi:nicotinamide phosphoribosyltransferase
MLENQNKMVFFGLQAFIKEYLIGCFKNNFFLMSEDEVIKLYTDSMDIQIGRDNYDNEKIIMLHRLGYLPLEIRALQEGTLIPMGVPCIEITNTHDDFAWLVQWIECILQVELWKPCCHATIGYMYREIADFWYKKTTDNLPSSMACADFGMRGMSCMDEAVRCSASWLLSFDKTSTIPAITYIDKYYNADCKNNGLGIGAVSTEHSVMGVNYSVDGDEITFVKKLLNELYPNTSFSMVSDTYDYWNLVNNILPLCKEDILKHNGKLLIRPDSGDIVEISVKTVEKLWEIFGGTVNSKGYKVLNPHIGIIYGDGCTLSNVATIWSELEQRGFAANNIVYGVGAFCFTAIVENGKLTVVTRDTFGIAMKATYGIVNGKKLMIYKDPKTDTSKLKKSHKGCCRVYEENGELKCQDELLEMSNDTLMTTVFRDGELVREDTFMDIREKMYGGN